ncbi:unnamed protein product [Pocillopora meandrina]|uniref:Uncharacterized protein n=1 Tax=Pocillopora meandrina TaxID=46732 RepID=A0AAU9WYH4_9CNID|nr:unnamed protein product [Pocillopora meandrina]
MDAISLNYWLTKFVMEVAKDSGEMCGLKRHLGDKYGDEALNPLDAAKKGTGN